jgi:hypothetical protein
MSDARPDDSGEPPVVLCPLTGHEPRDVLLVAGDDDRVVVVHADSSTTEIEPHSYEAQVGEHTAMLDAAGPYVVTASGWRDDSGVVMTDIRLFHHDGELLWTVSLSGTSQFGPRVSEGGEVVFPASSGAMLIRDGNVTALPGFEAFGRAAPPWLPGVQDGDPKSVGWIRTDTLAYVPSGVTGPDVVFDGEKFVGASWGEDGVRVQWAAPGEQVVELFFAHAETTDSPYGGMHSTAWPFVLLMDEYEFTTIVRVDLEQETAEMRPLDPPTGYAPAPCGWPTILADGTVLMPFSDGSRLQLFELPLAGEWRVTTAQPLSGTRGARGIARGGTYVFGSIESANPCDTDEPLAEIEGTLRGNSMQVFRPDSGAHLEFEQLLSPASALLMADGSCAALVAPEYPAIIADMELGTYAIVDAPTTSGVVLAGQPTDGRSFSLAGE